MKEQEVFVDTGAWLALVATDDSHHEEAKEIYPSLLADYQRLITTNLVVSETYIAIRKAVGHKAAIFFLEKIQESPRIEKVCSTGELEDEAYKLLKKYEDQDFSFVDAVSFCLMKRRAIKKAFAFDSHFVTAGFTLLPGR